MKRTFLLRPLTFALVLMAAVTARAQVTQSTDVSRGAVYHAPTPDMPALEPQGLMDAPTSYAPSYQEPGQGSAIDTTRVHPNALPRWQGLRVDMGPFDIFGYSDEVMGLMGSHTATIRMDGSWGRLHYDYYATMGKYDSAFLGHYDTFSVGGTLKVGVTPRLNIGVSGQYTPTAVKSRLLYPFTPTSNYSVMFEFKVRKGFWLGFKVGRLFNPVNKSWHSFGGPTYR